MNPQRKAIADAMSRVDGVTGYEVMPDVIAPGAAWPQWTQTIPRTACSSDVTWYVLVALPPDTASAIEAADSLVDAVMSALTDLGTVELAEPVELAGTDPAGNLVPALRVRVTI